jgi:hypothetical protein
MFANISFIFFFYLFLITIIGHGRMFSFIFYPNFSKLNFGYQGLIGIFFLSLTAMLSSFFFAHSFVFNCFILLIGFISFFYKQDKISFKKDLKFLALIALLSLVGLYIFKNHDDFPYYHLPYSLTLVENQFILGMGNLGHGYRTPSSIFYFNSLLYFPYIKYYLFHAHGLYTIIFFNIICLKFIFEKINKKSYDFFYFLYLLSFIFVNCFFYRIAEFGADRAGQILVFLIFIKYFEILNLTPKSNDLKKDIVLIILFTALAASMKAYFFIYFFIPIILFFNKKRFLIFFNLKFIKIFSVISFFILLIFSINFLSTGCVLYPAKQTCNENLQWSIKKDEVQKLKTHYEWWAKAGGGSNYSVEAKKSDYIKNFNWVNNWIKKYFFNKVSDFLLGLFFLLTLTFYLFYRNHKKKNKKKFNYLFPLILSLIFLLEWFLFHPALRYGGYVLISLTLFIIFSLYLKNFKYSYKKNYNLTVFLIFLTFLVYNGRNISRLSHEIAKYNYDILNYPFFNVPNVNYKISFNENGRKIYKPIDNMCWSTPTPCSNRSKIKMIYINKYKSIIK